jgi:hypothetical protein
MGSSMVMMWHSRVVLMWSIMAARVVVFPDPVGPVTRTRPRCSRARRPTTSGTPSSPKLAAEVRTSRKTRATEPRCRKALARNRPMPGTE